MAKMQSNTCRLEKLIENPWKSMKINVTCDYSNIYRFLWIPLAVPRNPLEFCISTAKKRPSWPMKHPHDLITLIFIHIHCFLLIFIDIHWFLLIFNDFITDLLQANKQMDRTSHRDVCDYMEKFVIRLISAFFILFS